MLSKDLIEKVKQIEIQTKRVLSGYMSGDYRTKSRGFGYDFDQLREYIQGDDIRFIDWKSSARTGKTLIRQYLEDKNRSVFIMLDVSGSNSYADRKELMATISSVIALAAFYNKDNVGLILFNNKVIKFISAKAGRQQVFKIIEEIYKFEHIKDSDNCETDISQAIKETVSRLKNNSIVFLISDFWDKNFYDPLKVFSRHHDVIVISCVKDLEKNLPMLGVLEFKDIETQSSQILNINGGGQKKVNNYLRYFREDFEKFCFKNSIDYLEIQNYNEIISKLIFLFKKRVKA